jgi:long-chain acyl-CoA synthetase
MLRYSGSGLAGVNTLFQGMMAHPDFDKVDFSRYVSVIAGGTALIKEISDEWRSKTGIDIQEGYGLSETASALTVNAPGARKLGSVGKILRTLDVALLDADGNEVEKGQPGEISVRGPIVMQGYWNKADATLEAITPDGFFRTGDIGTVDDEGFITIVDRVKDMIIVSGFNVYPNEVESVVYGHPSVVECAAVGVKSDTTGEAIKLYVVSKDATLTANDLIAFCRQELTGYKVPKDIEFRSDLPKSNVGKILRRSLRDEANA